MKRVTIPLYALLASLLVFFSLPATASGKRFDELIIFSGSLSDSGNWFAVHGSFPPPFAPNRSTNGPNLDDFFSEALGFKNKPSMHLVGPVQGNNFAVFQALAAGNGPEDLPAEITAYLNSRGGRANPNALFFVFIGGSDVINAILTPDDAASSRIIDGAVAGIEVAIRRLAQAGARTIFAPNFVDLGTTPGARKLGNVERSTRISREYNRKFERMLDRMDRELRRVELIRWDFGAWSDQLFKHAFELGFTNTTDACLDLIATGQCDPERFVFLTDFFPTSKTHRLFAIGAAQALIQRDAPRCGGHHGHGEHHGCRGNDD
jgi:cholinesterase